VRPDRSSVALSIFATLLAGAAAGASPARADVNPSYGNHLLLSAGFYSLKSSTDSIAQPGSLSLEYARSLGTRWLAFVGYSDNLDMESGFRNLAWGMELGAEFCLFSGYQEVESIGSSATISQSSDWALYVGSGLAQRSFAVSTGAVGLSGPEVRVQGFYQLSDRTHAVMKVENSFLGALGGGSSLNVLELTVGVGLSF
jgi:hypothetical protein